MTHRAYRALLLVLPGSFREEFTEEMVAVFADQRTRAHAAGVIGLWLATIIEVLTLRRACVWINFEPIFATRSAASCDRRHSPSRR